MRHMLKARPEEEVDKLERLSAQQRDLERQIAALQQRLASSQTQDYFSEVQEVNGVKVLALQLEDFDRKALRSFVDTAKDRLGSGVVLVSAVEDDRVSLVAGVTKDLTDRISAGSLMSKVAPLLGGKGGGRPDMAQGGGTDVAKLPEALAQVPDLVADLL
jgi:alanyl-tRNA synthetase